MPYTVNFTGQSGLEIDVEQIRSPFNSIAAAFAVIDAEVSRIVRAPSGETLTTVTPASNSYLLFDYSGDLVPLEISDSTWLKPISDTSGSRWFGVVSTSGLEMDLDGSSAVQYDEIYQWEAGTVPMIHSDEFVVNSTDITVVTGGVYAFASVWGIKCGSGIDAEAYVRLGGAVAAIRSNTAWTTSGGEESSLAMLSGIVSLAAGSKIEFFIEPTGAVAGTVLLFSLDVVKIG